MCPASHVGRTGHILGTGEIPQLRDTCLRGDRDPTASDTVSYTDLVGHSPPMSMRSIPPDRQVWDDRRSVHGGGGRLDHLPGQTAISR